MKNIMVAGGAGFLGSNLCERLIKEGHRVVCLDNLYTGRRSNIENLFGNEKFSFVESDIENPIKISKAMGESIDEIYNLACPASPLAYQKSPIKTIRTNVLGMMNVLELANICDAKILQASTSEIYGDPEIHPQPENYRGNVNPIGIRACYDEGKRCAETLCFDYNRKFKTKIKVVRIFNTYGPKMNPEDGRVVSNFILQALKDQDLTIYGDGMQTRSFCYVDDLIDGLIKMMSSDDKIIGPINLGNPIEFTVLELANEIIKKTSSKSKITFLPLPLDDPTKRKPLIGLALSQLNWKPNVMLKEGLEKTIEYYIKTI